MSDYRETLSLDQGIQVCEHGSQRRKCVHCESIWQDAEIDRLTTELAALRARLVVTDEMVEMAYDAWSQAYGGLGGANTLNAMQAALEAALFEDGLR